MVFFPFSEPIFVLAPFSSLSDRAVGKLISQGQQTYDVHVCLKRKKKILKKLLSTDCTNNDYGNLYGNDTTFHWFFLVTISQVI